MVLLESQHERFQLENKQLLTSFHGLEFSRLNSDRCDQVKHLLFAEGKIQIGISLGIAGREWKSPFSAPFGGFTMLQGNDPGMKQVDELMDAFVAYAIQNKVEKCSITFPPIFYNPSLISKVQSACFSVGFKQTAFEINAAINLKGESLDSLLDKYSRNATRAYRYHMSLPHVCQKHTDVSGMMKAFEMIKKNRASKGYGLSMDDERFYQTIQTVPVEAFVLSSGGTDLASAVVFLHQNRIAQVVYWGDVPNPFEKSVMSTLNFHLQKEYLARNFDWIDIGTSMIDGHPNYGLCDFKDSIGCDGFPKLTLEWSYESKPDKNILQVE